MDVFESKAERIEELLKVTVNMRMQSFGIHVISTKYTHKHTEGDLMQLITGNR